MRRAVSESRHGGAHRRGIRVARFGRPSRVLGGLVSALGMVCCTLAAPAGAAGESVGLSLYSVDERYVRFNVCMDEGDALPARMQASFTVSSGGSTVATVDWSSSDPTALLIGTAACPTAFVTLSTPELASDTEYTVSVSVTLRPKVAVDDGYVDDASRSPVTLTGSLVARTLASPPAGEIGDTSEGGEVDGESGSTGGTSGGSTGSTNGGTSGGSTGSAGGGVSGGGVSGGGAIPVVISSPGTFRPAQLVALSPAQVSTITPAAFGQLPPALFRVLSSAQAAEVTAEQASTIRPARAAELRPATLAALVPAAVAVMRPASIRSLTPAAIGAMTPAQLKALTPRQVDALRPTQLDVLSAVEKALLRRR